MAWNFTKVEQANNRKSRKNSRQKREKNINIETLQEEDTMPSIEMFEPEDPKRDLDKLIVSEEIMERILNALSNIQYHETLYNEWNLKDIDPRGKRVVLNFFGAPGTGKSFCAEAIAHKLGKKIIKINYAEIESKYVGETPKNITAAFKKAKETEAILFFDEADSILGKRLTNVTQSADHGVNVSRATMLKQLDEFDGIVLFATNLAKNFDGAFVRRILDHIEFTLPDEEARVRLWNVHTPKELPIHPDVTGEFVASLTEGFSGGDILNLVVMAAQKAVRRSGDAKRILPSDIEIVTNNIRNGKEKVGAQESQGSPKVTEVPLEEAPPDVQEKVQKIAMKKADQESEIPSDEIQEIAAPTELPQ